MRSLRWTPIPLGVGFALIAYQHFQRVREREHRQLAEGSIREATPWELSVYRLLPLRTVSRVWGWLSHVDLPLWARTPVLTVFARSFDCNLLEAAEEDLCQYRSLGDFFRRGLKPDARQIHPGMCVVSPADGVVMSAGCVNQGTLEQIKGVTYSLAQFLGPSTWKSEQQPTPEGATYQDSLLRHPGDTSLFYYVVYLKPGDYHRFHSPVEWDIAFRRHFTGDLLSVKPGIAKRFPGLFTLNERSVYVGEWRHGFFAMAAVGATNVGSIKVYKDPELQTNCMRSRKGKCADLLFSHGALPGLPVSKGEPFGEFNFGSTVVIIFEAPKDFAFSVEAGQTIRMGQSLNECQASIAAATTCAN